MLPQGGGREIMAARHGVYAKRLRASSYNEKNQFKAVKSVILRLLKKDVVNF